MTHNKSKKYIFCKKCDRKRYCIVDRSSHSYKTIYNCSKNHTWKIKKGILEQIISIEIDRIIPNLKNLFERDDVFYKQLK